MNPNLSSTVSTRRQLLLKSLPAGTLFCFGCSRLSAFEGRQPAPPKHKFSETSGMTFEEVFKFAFQNGFIPVLKGLAEDIGKDKFDALLRKACARAATEEAKRMWKDLPKRDPAALLAPLKGKDPFWQHVVTFEIVEETDKTAEVRITECLWAKTFREVNAGDLGYSAICYPDYAAAPAFNPKMKLVRAKTLMQGHDCCNPRWVLG